MAYDRAYAPPVVDELPESPSTAQKKKSNGQIGAVAFYESRKAEDILCQFVNCQAYSGTLTRREIVRANASLGELRRDKKKLSSPISCELRRVKAS